MHELYIFGILLLLIIVYVLILKYAPPQKEAGKEGFEDVSASGDFPIDATNPNLTHEQYYGEIPQTASISIYKSNELVVATANPDAIPSSDGDSHGAGAGPYLNLTNFDNITSSPDDIEVILNDEVNKQLNVNEGFQVDPGLLSADNLQQTALDQLQSTVEDKLQRKLEQKLGGKVAGEAAERAATTTAGKAATSTAQQAGKGTGQATSALRGVKSIKNAMDAAKAKATQIAKLGKARAAAVANAAKARVGAAANALKGRAAKVATRIVGPLARRVGATTGLRTMKTAMTRILTRAATIITQKAGIAFGTGAAAVTNPVTAAIGYVLIGVAVLGISVSITLGALYQDGAECDAGWELVANKFPPGIDEFMSMVPGLDLISAMAPYMCSIDRCEPGEDENAGLCYPACDPGYTGRGPICWTNEIGVGVGVLKDCPPGYNNDGLICREPLRGGNLECSGDPRKPVWESGHQECRSVPLTGGTLIGRMNKDWRLNCPGDHPEEIDGLCYRPCPEMGGDIETITKVFPVYIKKLPSENQDIAQKELTNALADKSTAAETIKTLQENLGKALIKDSSSYPDPNAPYVRNPAGPRIGAEPVDANGDGIIPRPPRRWPATEIEKYTDLLAAVENGKVVLYSAKLGGWMTFESVYGGYGKQLDTDGRKAVKVTMTEVGPQIITDVDGRCYRWNTDMGDWEWNKWGNFKDIAAANNSFTYFMGMNDKLYSYRWKGNPRGLEESGGEAAGGWYAMKGVAANDYANGYANKDNDHGNLFTTNSAGWEAIIVDWNSRYLWGNDKTYDKDKFGQATDVAMSPNSNLQKYIATDKGYIYVSSGFDISKASPEKEVAKSDSTATKQIIEGPIVGTAITAITVDQNNTVYAVSGGRLFKQAPIIGSEPPMNVPEIKMDPCATKIPQPFGQPFCIPGIITTGLTIPNPTYKEDYADWKARKGAAAAAVNGWIEIVGKTVTDIAIGPPVINDQFTAYTKYKSYLEILERDVYPKYPFPDPTVEEENIPTVTQTIIHNPKKKLRHIPLMPFQCMGDRGIAYGRGVGKPKLKTRMASKPKPPPAPPPAWLSSSHADDPNAPSFVIDFSNQALLQEACLFYYNANVSLSEKAKDGSIVYSYPTRITAVIASSEQSADVLCDVTTTFVNPETGELLSTTVSPNSDRRFYFAFIQSTKKMVVTACTNMDGTANYTKSTLIKNINFVPTLNKCMDNPLTFEMCSDPLMINKMIKFYTNDPLGNICAKEVLAIQVIKSTCLLVWTSTLFDPDTNEEGDIDTNAARFVFEQNTKTDACVYILKSFSSVEPSMVKPLETPISLVCKPHPPGNPPVTTEAPDEGGFFDPLFKMVGIL